MNENKNVITYLYKTIDGNFHEFERSLQKYNLTLDSLELLQ